MKIEANKYYSTRDGQKVRVVCTNGHPDQPVVGYFEKHPFYPTVWTSEGTSILNGSTYSADLIAEWQEEPAAPLKRKRRVIYVNEYRGIQRSVSYYTRKDAEGYALGDRIRLSRWVEDLKFRDDWDRGQKNGA